MKWLLFKKPMPYILTVFTIFVFFSGCSNFELVKKKPCWNDTNFKKIERQLYSSPVIKTIPLYKYLNLPKLPGGIPSFILILNNNLKAVFKPCTSTLSYKSFIFKKVKKQ